MLNKILSVMYWKLIIVRVIRINAHYHPLTTHSGPLPPITGHYRLLPLLLPPITAHYRLLPPIKPPGLPIGIDPGSIQDRFRIDPGSIQDRSWIDPGSIQDRSWIDPGYYNIINTIVI